MSRKQNLQDIWQRMLITSDPYICSLRTHQSRTNTEDLPGELRDLLKETIEWVEGQNKEMDHEHMDIDE